MSNDFNVNHISYRFFGDKLTSLDLSNNLIIEASDNNIELKTANKTISFNNNTIFNYGLALKNNDLSNIINITGKILNIDTLFVTDIVNSQANIDDYGYINNGYIRATTIGYNPAITNSVIGSSIAYFTYIDVSGGDSSFNNSVYIKNSLDVSGATTISNDLIVNGTSYVTLYNAISNYIINIKEELSSNKILTLDLSATNISVSNELVVSNTSFLNNISISGHLLDSVLKVPHDFTIDPSGHDNASGTLIINGDLIVYGNKTTINSNIVEISDITLSVATNLMNANDLYNNQAGLDISNVASIKYDGTNWNFNGGQLTVENKKVSLDVSLIALKTSTITSLNSLNNYFDVSYIQLVNNNDNSYNATYSRSQIDASFLLKSDFDISYNSFITYLDNSYVKTTTFDASFSSLKTYLDASYILKSTSTIINSIDLSLNFLRDKLDLSYVLKSTFESSYNSLKEQIEISFGSIRLTSLDTSSISVETINTKHSSQRFNNILWNQIGLDISNGPPLINNNKKVAISNDGKVVAFASSAFASSGFVSTASGGTITISGGYAIHRFDTSGTFTPYFSGNVEVLLVGGGGGGGPTYSGGGGGGGVVYITSSYVTSDTSYSVVIGSGGASGTKGHNTTVFGATAAGGGTNLLYDMNGTIGGCGGGAGASQSRINIGGASSGNIIGINNGIANVGFIYGCSGGNTTTIRDGTPIRAAGGGGAGAQGAATDTQSIGDRGQFGHGSGGIGITNSILGTSYYWGGGGGGSAYIDQSGGYGGYGGGGGGSGNAGGGRGGVLAVTDGSNGGLTIGGPGGANTGGGGGGGRLGGGAGGSGIVVIRYLQITSYPPKGRIYVYELSYNQAPYRWNQLGLSSEIIVGLSNDDQFGWDLALSSNGRVVAGSSIANDASGNNSGQVRIFELSNNSNRWTQKGFNINGPKLGSESGYSISLAGNGNRIAIGAWKDNSNGTNSGAVRVYDFSANVNDWRQKGQTIAGVSGSFEGYATALSLDGQTLASASILEASRNGQVKTFTISGTTWNNKGSINGIDISFGRAIKLSANGNVIVIGAPGYSQPITPTSSSSFAISATSLTRDQHITTAASVPGRTLGSILNVSEKETVRLIMQANTSDVYIGARRRATSTNATGRTSLDWEWVSGDVWDYQNFQAGDPNNLSYTALIMWGWGGAGDWYNTTGNAVMKAIYKTTTTITSSILNIGRAYVYGFQGGTTWTQLGQTIQGISGGDEFGSSVSMSNDGTIIAVGSDNNSSNRGQVRIFAYANNYWTQISNAIDGKTASSRAGIHALSGDGTTLIQSNNSYSSVYGINKTLAVNAPMTSISGNLLVLGNISVNSLDISTNHSYSSNGYSYKMFGSDLNTAIMKEYYSNVSSNRHLKVQITGNGYITNRNNSYRALSDSRLKENIQDSGPKLEDLLKVRVVDYTMKGSNNTKYIGVVAQELEDVFPNLVTELEPSPKDIQDGNTIKYKAVNYSSFDAILIKSLQEQNAMLKNIEKRIIALEDELDDNSGF